MAFRIGPSAAELEAQMQRDPCLSLLEDIRLRQHVPGQLCWQIHEVAGPKEMGQLTTARA